MDGTNWFVGMSNHTMCLYVGAIWYIPHKWSVGIPVRTDKTNHGQDPGDNILPQSMNSCNCPV